MVYLSEYRSLAALEILIHAKRPQLLDDDYLLIEVSIPDELVLTLDQASLKPGWNDPSDFSVSQAVGDAWLTEAASVGLRVPSAVVPEEANLLLAPGHPDFSRVEIGAARPFLFNPRLAN